MSPSSPSPACRNCHQLSPRTGSTAPSGKYEIEMNAKSEKLRATRLVIRNILVMGLLLCPLLGACAGVKDSPQAWPVVLIDRAVYFINTEGTDAIAAPGLYDVEPAAESRLRLIPIYGKDGLVIQAMALTHEEEIPSPVALALPSEETEYHLVLLLPDGKALDASGSTTQVRARGSSPARFLQAQVHSALKRLRTLRKVKTRLEEYPRLRLGKDEWQYQINDRWMTEPQAIEYLMKDEQ